MTQYNIAMAKHNQYYDIVENKATKVAEILIYGVIGESWWEESITARRFVRDFKQTEKDHDIINIRINSPGGSVFDGLAIFNAISGSTKQIHTYNDGLCASMAAVLLLAADLENVHPAKNSLLMLHSPSTGAWGNRLEIEKALDILDKVQKVLVTSICDKTGLDEAEVEAKYFDYKDHWFTADEAKEAGLYANIEEDEAENVPQNAMSLKFSDLVKLFEPSNNAFPEWISKVAPALTNSNSINDMDIQKIRDAYNLTEDKYPTEEDVLNFVKQRETEFKNMQTAKETAESDLATANQTIADKDAVIATLQKGPGAQSATVTPTTDKVPTGGKEEEPAEDFMTAYSSCMNVLNPKK